LGELTLNTGDALLGFLNRVERTLEAGLPTQQGSSFAFQANAELLGPELII
jgi:hypothetical protein